MARRNRKDNLTIFKNKSANWFINFRVPESHVNHPLFQGKTVYQKSTGTSSYAEACRIRDEFFKAHHLFGHDTSPKEIYLDRLHAPTTTNEEEWSEHLLPMAIEASLNNEEMPEPYRSAYEGILNQRRQNERPLQEIDHPFQFSLQDAYKEYISLRQRDLPDKTLAKVEKARTRLLEFVKATDIPLESLSTPIVYRFILFLTEQGLSQSTIRNDLSFLGSIFDHAKRQGKVKQASENPFRNQKIPASSPAKVFDVKAMPYDHAKGLYEEAQDRDMRLLILISHYLGTRISETYTCRFRIDNDGEWYADVAIDFSGKTQSSTRKIPLPPSLKAALEKEGVLPEQTNTWKSPSPDSLGKRFGRFKGKYFDAQGLTHHRVLVDHSFRHAFATYLANKFGELRSAMLTGHKLSNAASTELGRTYFSGTEWSDLKKMMREIPDII